jgi:hypothetical protein
MAEEKDKSEGGAKDAEDIKRSKQRVRAGVAVGIGSAAIVAALLYANRSRKADRDKD